MVFDYHRFRYKTILKPRGPIPRTTSGRTIVPIPDLLRWTAWLGWVVAGIAIAIPVSVGWRTQNLFLAFIGAQVLLLPITATLAAGFSERQSWTRPLLLILLLVATAIPTTGGFYFVSIPMGIVLVGVSMLLYRSKGVREYYACLREEAVIQLEIADLGKIVFVPLYTGALGIIGGLVFGWWIVGKYHSMDLLPSGADVNQLYASILGSVLCAAVFGPLGKLFGEALARRLSRGPTSRFS